MNAMPPSDEVEAKPSRIKQLGWLVLIWALSITALGVVAWVIKLFLKT